MSKTGVVPTNHQAECSHVNFRRVSSWRRGVALVALLASYNSFAMSVQVPNVLFPLQAHRKGASQVMVGLVLSLYGVANFLSVPLVVRLLERRWVTRIFLSLQIARALAMTAFGYMLYVPSTPAFIAGCSAMRVLSGVMGSALYTSSYDLLTGVFPAHTGKVIGLLEFALTGGTLLGPLLTSLLYSLGGYTLPFLCAGAWHILLTVISVILLPARPDLTAKTGEAVRDESSDSTKSPEFVWYKHPVVIAVSFCSCLVSSILGFTGATLAVYLSDSFGITSDTAGVYFALPSMLGVTVALVVGVALDRGWLRLVLLLAVGLGAAGFACLALPLVRPDWETRVNLCIGLCLVGLSYSVGYTTSLQCMQDVLSACRSPQTGVRLVVANWSNLCYQSGLFLGQLALGGALFQLIGFHRVCLVLSGAFLLGLLSLAITFRQVGILNAQHCQPHSKLHSQT